MDRRGNMPSGPLPQHGEAGIAAGAENHVGLELVDDFIGPPQGPPDGPDGPEIVGNALGRQLPLKIGDGQRPQIKPLPGHQLRLHAVVSADKENVAVGTALPQELGDGNGRIDMAAGAAAGKDDIHGVASRTCCRLRLVLREILRMMPISPSCIIKAVPP